MAKKKFKKECKNCGKRFEAMNVRKEHCSDTCKSSFHRKNNKKMFNKRCKECRKSFTTPSEKTRFCSPSCVATYKNRNGTGKKIKCKQCSKKFKQKHRRHFFCSDYCKGRWGVEHSEKAEIECSHCDGKFERSIYQRAKDAKNVFCSRKCESKFREKESYDKRTCEHCGRIFDCKKGDKNRFCSRECQGKWQSEYRIGTNSSNYDTGFSEKDRNISCEQCGKNVSISKSEKKFKKYCSRKCKGRHLSRMAQVETKCPCCKEIFLSAKSLKRKYCSKKCSVKSQGTTMTSPHRKTVSILRKNRIWNRSEHKVGRYLLDCYLGKGLAIEVQGRYWHGDIRFFKKPKNKMQQNMDKKDRRKKNLLSKNGITVLYIWEDDIENNPEMCEKLILKFKERNGILSNYHSMNYHTRGRSVALNRKILTPRFEI